MRFFVSSVGKGNGADLGGLKDADAHCAALARAAGSTQTNWRAYLSTTMPGGDAGINARDRIGKGPWQNAKGVVVDKSVDDLHSENANITKETALTEKGEMVSGRGDSVNQMGRCETQWLAAPKAPPLPTYDEMMARRWKEERKAKRTAAKASRAAGNSSQQRQP
jgi:hypothetical protein